MRFGAHIRQQGRWFLPCGWAHRWRGRNQLACLAVGPGLAAVLPGLVFTDAGPQAPETRPAQAQRSIDRAPAEVRPPGEDTAPVGLPPDCNTNGVDDATDIANGTSLGAGLSRRLRGW